MFIINLIKVFASVIVFGLVLVQHTHSHVAGQDHDGFWSSPERETFLPVTEDHRAAWDRVLEDCFPLNTRDSLSDQCITSLGEYFANEPVWSYAVQYLYDHVKGWAPMGDLFSLRKSHSRADFLNLDVPLWKHIFDDQIEQRQERFLQVVNDAKCLELASSKKEGIHDSLAEHCAARELYKYATYLYACTNASKFLARTQKVFPDDAKMFGGFNQFEISLQALEDSVSDEGKKSAAKHHMEESYLHAAWVTAQCGQHGFIVRPGRTTGSYTSTEERLPWSELSWNMQVSMMFAEEYKYHRLIFSTHEFIMKIAMKSGNDWAIRTGYLGQRYIASFADDLMQRYPLLMHRVIGNLWGNGNYGKAFSEKEHARHRAKAYLLLVEAAGEEFARSEIDPTRLANEIRYVKRGGALTDPLSHAQVQAERKEWRRQLQMKKLRQESQGELTP
ncbi:MAG: hypothetical protein OXG88_05820 [Gammaproteobacteria bacterium]|nr:hypothetical protein [Gammaproteobacteria bacterium]